MRDRVTSATEPVSAGGATLRSGAAPPPQLSRRAALASAAGLAAALWRWPASPVTLAAEETPSRADSWTTFRNSPENLGVAHGSLPDQLHLLWEKTTPDGTASTPVIADGRVYAGTLSGEVHCLALATGEDVWTYKSLDEVPANSFAPGFNAPLALGARAVFAGDDAGTFHAIDRETGRRLWTFETDGEIVGGAQIVAQGVLFGSHDGHLYCLNPESGEQVWAVETHGPVNATPCLAGQYTFTTGCDQPILRVVDLEAGKEAAEAPLKSLLIATPAHRDGILYFGTDSGAIYALDWRRKELVWEYATRGEQQINSSPAVTDEVVVIGCRDKNIYCLDRKTGELRWSFATRARIDSSPVIVGERVFFGASDRFLYAVRLTDGQEVFKQSTGQAMTGSAAVAEGCLVIGTDPTRGRILCFGAAP